MALGYNPTLRNNQLDEITGLAGASCEIILYSGTQPATGGTATTEVATLTGNATAFAAAATGGVLTLNAITDDTSATGGTATWFRINSSGGATHVMDGTVGTSGTDLVLNNNVITATANVSISSFTITAGNA